MLKRMPERGQLQLRIQACLPNKDAFLKGLQGIAFHCGAFHCGKQHTAFLCSGEHLPVGCESAVVEGLVPNVVVDRDGPTGRSVVLWVQSSYIPGVSGKSCQARGSQPTSTVLGKRSTELDGACNCYKQYARVATGLGIADMV